MSDTHTIIEPGKYTTRARYIATILGKDSLSGLWYGAVHKENNTTFRREWTPDGRRVTFQQNIDHEDDIIGRKEE